MLLLLLLGSAILAGSCDWFRQKKRSVIEPDRHEIAHRTLKWVQSSGGSQVWIKLPPRANFPATKLEKPAEAVVVSGSYPALIESFQHNSARNGLTCELRETRNAGGYRTADLRLTRREKLICRWHIQEVPRLLRAAIVIDDMGQDPEAAQKLLALHYPVTFSVLPKLPHSTQTAEEAHHAGREVMLHLPMEAEPGAHPSPGQGEVKTGMRGDEVKQVVDADLDSVPYVAGVNNHMGSRATVSLVLMRAVMKDLAERRLYFVDSRTTAQTVALDAARREGVPAFYRSVFLDDTETVPYTLGQLREFRHTVELQGVALAIGHPHPTTISALQQFLPELERENIQLVPPSELVSLPEAARLWPAGHREQP